MTDMSREAQAGTEDTEPKGTAYTTGREGNRGLSDRARLLTFERKGRTGEEAAFMR